jgi:short-subunit dehydrogenase
VSDVNSIVATGKACIASQGLPDVVIANAGISVGVDTSIREDLDQLAQTYATNNIGLAATFHPFIDGMLQRKSGKLVGIGSVAGIRGMPGHGAYCASKAAVISYCESLRGELRGSGVQVVTICPGYVKTPMTANNNFPMPFLMESEDFAKKSLAKIEAGSSYSVIPWQMGVVAKLLRLLPNAVFDKALAGRARKARAP